MRPLPRRLFRRKPDPVSAIVSEGLAALADRPELAAAFREAVAVTGDLAMWEAIVRTAPGQRGTIIMAFRSAAEALASGKPCDFCATTARRIRFLRPARPAAGSIMGFVCLCDACARKPQAELARLTRDKASRLDLDLEAKPYYRRAILGRRIGETSGLPARACIQDCGTCGQSMWYDHDDRDWGRDDDRQVTYVCIQCAARLAAAGRLHNVPSFLTS